MRRINGKEYLTTKEIATQLDVSRRTIHRWMDRKKWFVKQVVCITDPINGYHYFEAESVRRLIQKFESSRFR